MSFMSWYTQEQYQPLLDAFKARYPNLTIDFQNVTPANNAYGQRLQLLASSGELPDLFYVQPPSTVMAKNGYLADLSHLDVVKALPPAFTTSYTYNKAVYAYAPDAWVGGVFYNKALFRDNNLSEPKTWADFVAAAKVFHSKGIIPVSLSGEGFPDLLYWLHNTEVLSADPQFDVKINTGQTTFTQGYLDAINTWKKDMLDTGYITQDMVGLNEDQRINQFATGQAAMTISGPWAVGSIKQKNPNIDLGIFPYVGSTSSKINTVGAVNVGLAISSKAQNKAAAQAFLSFLGSPDGLALYQKITGNFLGVTGISYKVDPVMSPMQQYAENGHFAFPPIDWIFTGTLAPMVTKGMQQLVLGVETPEQFVKDLDAKQTDLASNQK
jgi:raffinose/stachyose/melibiose transport system substrate-binding protein